MKCHHLNPSLPYLAGHADADRRLKLGQKQRQCPVCQKWIWPTDDSMDSQTDGWVKVIRQMRSRVR